MAAREQRRRPAPGQPATVEEQSTNTTKQGDKIKAELDELLDEIDEVLEENADEFVKSYIQKGGQ